MTYCWRVASGMVLLLVMLGLPVAPVVCELACPLPTRDAAVTEPLQVVASASTDAPCHRPAGAPDAGDMAAAALGMGAGTGHGCDHPPVLSSPRAPEALRMPEPLAAAWATSRHLSLLAARHANVATLAAARAPSPPVGAAFSPVLRI